MKLLIDNTRILATALDDYIGELTAIDAPADFDSAALERYEIVDGQVQLKIPHSVTRLQARLALIDAGLWDAVTAYFNQPERTSIELAFWEDAQTWQRDNAALIAAAEAIALDRTGLDDLFVTAAEL